MSNKLIDLNALSEYKTQADLKYQDKLTAGDSISLINDVITLSPTYVNVDFDSAYAVANNTLTNLKSITLMPGKYILSYGWDTPNSDEYSGLRQCGFSINTTDLTGFGRNWGDFRIATLKGNTPNVFGIFSVSASDYPSGRTFYFLAQQTNGSSVTLNVSPKCYYLKF